MPFELTEQYLKSASKEHQRLYDDPHVVTTSAALPSIFYPSLLDVFSLFKNEQQWGVMGYRLEDYIDTFTPAGTDKMAERTRLRLDFYLESERPPVVPKPKQLGIRSLFSRVEEQPDRLDLTNLLDPANLPVNASFFNTNHRDPAMRSIIFDQPFDLGKLLAGPEMTPDRAPYLVTKVLIRPDFLTMIRSADGTKYISERPKNLWVEIYLAKLIDYFRDVQAAHLRQLIQEEAAAIDADNFDALGPINERRARIRQEYEEKVKQAQALPQR